MTKPKLSFWQIWNLSFGFLGVQIGYSLQNSNTSSIFESLGADVSHLSYFWLAAPLAGMIVQPIVGLFSDGTWTRWGRRIPYILGGSLISALSLVLTMVLRLVPSYRRKADALMTARACIGKGPAEGASVAARVRDGGSVLLSLSADALESAVVAADSMTARGFGLSGRTHFALFRWEARDTVLVVAMGALVVGAVAAFAQGGFAITYFPTIVWPSAGAAVLMGAVCYGAFLAIPAVINCGGRALWRYSLSKS